MTLVYDGVISGAAINAAMTITSGAIVIPYSNGQRVAVIQLAA